MMHRSLYEEIKRLFTTVITDQELPDFVTYSLEEKVEVVQEIITKNPTPYLVGAGVNEAKCYVLIMHLGMDLLKPGTPEHLKFKDQLQIPVVSKWPKANPPTNQFDMFNEKRSPSWMEEANKISAAARLIGFDSINNYEDIVVAVKTTLGIGGMEDLGDERAIPKTDLTLKLGVEYVQYNIKTMRPEWCTPDGQFLKSLSPNVDPRPKYVLEAEEMMAEEARRADKKRRSEEDRRKKLQDEYVKHKKAVFDALKAYNITAFVDECVKMGFDVFKEYVKPKKNAATWLPDKLLTPVSKLVPMELSDEEKQDKEKVQKMFGEKVHFIEQYVFTAIKARQSAWFRDLTNGDLALRRGIENIDRFTRPQRSIYTQLTKLIEKYGSEEVALRTLEMFGISKTPKEVFGEIPKKPAIVVTEEEAAEK